MIDTAFQVIKTVMNKELRGNFTPTEGNLVAKQVQDEIFRGYFEDANRDKVRFNRGLANLNFANLPFVQRQRIEQFQASATLAFNDPDFTLPANLYLIKDNGITTSGGVVIQEMESNKFGYMNNSLAAPSTSFPVYTRKANTIQVYPASINTGVVCNYLRTPADPNWTYTVVGGTELFNPADVDYQDFELHESEFSNIVVRMLSYFGINIREAEVTQYAEALKQKNEVREES
jgi:hypothetical protein